MRAECDRASGPLDHDALSQLFIEKASEAFYFAGGRWYRQLTGD